MKILVTGATGFVGHAVTRSFAAREHDVLAAVRARVDQFEHGIDWIAVGDFNDVSDWRALVTDCEAVVHLAAYAHDLSAVTPAAAQRYHNVNVDLTARIATAAVNAGIEKFVYLSSVKIYGEHSRLNTAGTWQRFTSTDPAAPESVYGETKWAAECELRAIAERNPALAISVLRAPLIYGEGIKANLLQLLKIVDRGVPLPFASVDNLRSYLGLNNLTDAIECALTRATPGMRVYPLSDIELSTPDLIRHLARALERSVRLFPCPPQLLDLLGRVAGKAPAVEKLTGSFVVDSTEIRRDLGWIPRLTVDQELANMVRGYRQQDA